MMVNDDCYKCKVSKANQSFNALPGLESGGRGCYSSTVLSLLELPLSHSDDSTAVASSRTLPSHVPQYDKHQARVVQTQDTKQWML